MRNLLLEHLAEALKSDRDSSNPNAPCLKDNIIAKQLFLNLRGGYLHRIDSIKEEKGRNDFMDMLRGLGIKGFEDPLTDEFFKIPPTSVEKDFRLRRLFLRNVRKFSYPYCKDGKLYYSVNFSSDDRKPCSTIVLGCNGSGKSSLFNALEYVMTGHIPTAETRRINDLKDYLQHKSKNSFPWEIGIDMADKWIYHSPELQSENNKSKTEIPVAGSACFCYQGDVEWIEKEEVLDTYLYDQLGLGFYYQLITLLRELLKEERDVWDKCKILYNDLKSLYRNFDILNIALKGDKKITGLLNNKGTYDIYTSLPSDPKACIGNLKLKIIGLRKWMEKDRKVLNMRDILKSREIVQQNIRIDSLCNRLSLVLDGAVMSNDLSEAISLWNEVIEELKIYRRLERDLLARVEEEKNKMNNGQPTLHQVFDRVRYEEKWIVKEEELKRYNRGSRLSREEYESGGVYSEENWIEWSGAVGALKDYLDSRLKSVIEKYLNDVMRPMISSLTNVYFKEVGNLKLDLNNAKLAMMIELQDNPDERLYIKQILNTFRMKVFTMSLKCALACCVMKIHNITLPLIIDDIFDSSDFTHRAGIYRYVRRMVKEYQNIMPKDKPLQIIFFTQDELVGEGVEKGIRLELGQSAVKMTRLVEWEYVNTLRDEFHTVSHTGKTWRHRRLALEIPCSLGIRLR